jgi:serine/threonine-protein kinase
MMTGQPPDSDQLDRLQAALADRYEVLDQVGQGGMATVYLARDIKHERNVALKVLRPELSASLGAERFLREIRVAANLQHPNILALYDSGDADGALYYVMPFVEGESLRDRLDRETQLTIPDALKIIREVSEALSYAHSQGVIHRDIKPENIMLMGEHALVADFGIARAVEEAGEDKLTQSGMSIGTPLYMSPEQATGVERLDGRSDIYSLGCMLYELLTGEPPYQGANAVALLAKHSMEAIPSSKVLRNTIPDEVDAAIGKAMAKVPADRFQTALQLAEALGTVEHRMSAGLPIQITAPIPAQPAPALPKRKTPSPMLMVAGGGLVLVVAAIAAWQLGLFGGGGSDGGFVEEIGPSPKNIAVLYFEDRSADQSLGYLADGFTEALIGELSQVQGLKVISRNGVRQFQNQRVSPDSISRALDVGTVVEGTVEQSGDQLRINVSLVNAVDGSEIGSTRLERTRAETFTLQDEVTRDVSSFLRIRLGEEILLRESRRGARNVAAWEKAQEAARVEQGVQAYLAAGDREAAALEFTRADSIFAEAAALDDEWASPVTARGWIAYRRARELAQGFDKAHYAEWIEEGTVYADQAVALDPDDPDALELHGMFQYLTWLLNLAPDAQEAERLFANAENDFRRSIAVNPNQASALNTLSHLLINKGEMAEANVQARKAYEADPYLANADVTIWRLFTTSIDLDEQVQANYWCEEGLRRFPANPRFTDCQIRLLAVKGQRPDIDKAWRLVQEYVDLSPPDSTLREFRRLKSNMYVAMALSRAGLPDSARAVAERSRGDTDVDPNRDLIYLEVIVRTFLGDMDEAFRLLSLFLASNPNQRETMARDQLWWFKDLRADPRYQALVGSS